MYNSVPPSSGATGNTLSAASRATSQFVRSPLVLTAIIAYTCYAAINAVQSLYVFDVLDTCFILFDFSVFLGLAMMALLFLFIAPVIVTVGLWIMYSHDGKQGANIVNAGINTHLGLFIGGIAGIALALISVGGLVGLGMVVSQLFLPVAYIAFSLVAIAWQRKFAEAVYTSAILKTARNNGVSTAGTLMIIHVALTLLAYLNIFDTLGSMNEYFALSEIRLTSTSELANIAHIAALLLFGISAFVFNNAILRARVEDRKQEPPQAAASKVIHVWQCSCGYVNPGETTTCICGASKDGSRTDHPQSDTTPQPNAASDDVVCPQCGTPSPADSTFCGHCGAKIL